jgi:tetratricopeptide (TPR) repeat protein
VRLNPGLVEAHLGLGYALQLKGDLDGAIPEYRTAIRLDPALAAAHHDLSSALLMKGNKEEAEKESAEAARLDPRFRRQADKPEPTLP